MPRFQLCSDIGSGALGVRRMSQRQRIAMETSANDGEIHELRETENRGSST